MTEPPDKMKEVRLWLRKAEHDLTNAHQILALDENTFGEECPFDTVCFHAQQCAEKYLKALLIFLGCEPPYTHDLVVLLKLIPSRLNIALDEEDVYPLNRYAVAVRYPTYLESVSKEEAVEAVHIAMKVRSVVKNCLPE